MKYKLILPLLLIAFSVNAQTPNYTATKFPNGLVPPSRSTAPIVSPGSLWHDVIANAMKWYNGTQWITVGTNGGITTETDPTVPTNVKAITATNISNWNTAFGWGNHAVAGYATQTYVDSRLTQTVIVTGTSQVLSSGTVYILQNSSLTTTSLPVSANLGDLIQIIGEGGFFRVSQNANQFVAFGNAQTTTGTTGYIQTNSNNTFISLRYVNTNKWLISSSNSTPAIF